MAPPRRTMSASDLKARCLRVLDEVAGSGVEVLVTKRGTPVARYCIHFGDGTDQNVDILYGRDILAFDSKSFIYEKLDRQAARLSIIGRTRLGRAVRFHALRWENPRPTVRIESVDLASLGTIAAPMVLAMTTESR